MFELEAGLGGLLTVEGRRWLEGGVLAGFLKGQRWFASKDRGIAALRVEHAGVVVLAGEELLLAEVVVVLGDREERYCCPLGVMTAGVPVGAAVGEVMWRGRQVWLVDGFALDGFAAGFVEAMARGAVFALPDGEIRCFAMLGLGEEVVAPGGKIRRLSGEQSNSSLVYGDAVIMKLMRRVMAGVNPEVEMVRHLTAQGYGNTPALLGEVQALRAGGVRTSMMVAQAFVPNRGDAWKLLVDGLRGAGGGDVVWVPERLGTRLAQLHAVMARDAADEAFAPVAATVDDAERFLQDALSQLNAAFVTLARETELPPPALTDRSFVLDNRQAILDMMPRLAHAGIGSLLTRIHGDFHLGQVLVTDDDVYIIDFEGEPAKPLAMRRAKSSPMRDTAGLIRSLHYAAVTANATQTNFITHATTSFLTAYRQIAHNAPQKWINNPTQETALLDLFLIEKSAYEICYEAANRPTWLPTPLRGFAEIATTILNPPPEPRHAQ